MAKGIKQHPERVEQRQIVALLRHLGAQVYVLGTTRKRGDHPGTMQSSGLPDVLAFLPSEPGGEGLLMVEVKARGGRRSPAQDAFADHCRQAGIAYVCGGFDTVIYWALAEGLIEGAVTDWRIPGRRRLA